MEFSRQEYWSRLPLPTPGDLPEPGIKPVSPAPPMPTPPMPPPLAGGFLTTATTWKALLVGRIGGNIYPNRKDQQAVNPN